MGWDEGIALVKVLDGAGKDGCWAQPTTGQRWPHLHGFLGNPQWNAFLVGFFKAKRSQQWVTGPARATEQENHSGGWKNSTRLHVLGQEENWGKTTGLVWVTVLTPPSSLLFLFALHLEWLLKIYLLIWSLMRLYFGLNKCFLDLSSDKSGTSSGLFPTSFW